MAHYAASTATAISAGSLFVYLLALPLFGWISDHLGRKATLGFAFGGCALISYPALTALMNGPSPWVAFLIVSALVFVLSGYNSVSAVVKAELFPANIRALGVALPYGMASATFGGTAEMIAIALKRDGHESWFFIYVAVILAMSFLVVLRLRDSKTHSLILED